MKNKVRFEDINKLFREAIMPFYQIKRDMPLPFPDKPNENDAEHSWSLAFLAVALAPEIDPSLDVGKVVIFAVIHDIVELYAGDTSIWDSKDLLATKAEREMKAIGEIEKRFPVFPTLFKTIKEYERKNSNEALFVWSLDKLISLLIRQTDEGEYYRRNKITKESFSKRMVEISTKAHAHPKVGQYYDELMAVFESNSKYFYRGKS